MKKTHYRIVSFTLLLALVLGALPVWSQDSRVVVTWYVGLGAGGQPAQIEAQNQVVADFNASQDRIQLEIVIVDNTVAYDTLGTLIASGQAPDIIGPVGSDGANAFEGRYLDLQPLVDSTGYDLAQFDEAAVESFRVNGELLGIPFATFPSFIFYNRDLFDEAGVDYPPHQYGEPYADGDAWDMEKMRELAIFLTVDSDGYDATEDEFNAENAIQWGFVSQWNEPRGHASLFGASNFADENGEAQLVDNWREGLNWFYNGIWTDNFIPNAAQQGSDLLAAGNPFASGRIAMAHSHLWYTCCIGEANNWDIAAVPSYDDVATAKLHGDTFRVLNTTANPEESFEVLTYLLGEAAPTLLQVYGGMPARAEQQEAFFADLESRFPQGVDWQVAIDSLAYADSPSHEAPMPNYLKAKDRVSSFQTLYESTPGLDVNAELDRLVTDLEAIFAETR